MIDIVRTTTSTETQQQPRFRPGDLVRHFRYGYRGVVVSVDDCCQAGMDWYLSNKTQPDLEQPWYHVLVHHRGTLCTYPAQENLLPDTSGEPVEHPWLEYFFEDFLGDHYIRNDRRWLEPDS